MYKERLLLKVAERTRWACNDARTYLFAKAQPQYRNFEQWLGGGNMAKPLIFFVLWDVLAGVLAHATEYAPRLLWQEEQDQAVDEVCQDWKRQLTELEKTENAFKGIRVLRPKIGEIENAGKALQVLLEAFPDAHVLGVTPSQFAHEIRPKYRNPLAHTYVPRLFGGASSSSPSPAHFDEVLHEVASRSSPVVFFRGYDPKLDAVAMLRDSDRLSTALTEKIQQSFTEEEAQAALKWMGLLS